MSNYICLTSSKLSRYKQYMYVDCKNYFADDLFIKNKITVNFKGDCTKDDSDYILLIMGHSDYESFCEKQINKILCKLN